LAVRKSRAEAAVLIENGIIRQAEALSQYLTGGVKDLKIGTLRHIIRQLDLDWEEFNQK